MYKGNLNKTARKFTKEILNKTVQKFTKETLSKTLRPELIERSQGV